MTALSDLVRFRDCVKVTGMEKADWIRRAKERKGSSKFTTPELIQSQELRVNNLRDLLTYLNDQIRAAQEAGHG